jgi:UPF0716 protein FxsA
MHPVKAIAIGLLAWPAAEIVAFFFVAAMVGFVNAVMLIVLASLAGALVLRHFSRGSQRIRTADGFIAASAWSGGMAPGLGGILLLIPGFLTTALGLIVLFPLPRRWLVAGFRRLLQNRERPPAEIGVIDLGPDEWRPLPAEKLPPSGPDAGKQGPARS